MAIATKALYKCREKKLRALPTFEEMLYAGPFELPSNPVIRTQDRPLA